MKYEEGITWRHVHVYIGSYRIYGWRGAHLSGGTDGGGGAGSGPDSRDHQRPGENCKTREDLDRASPVASLQRFYFSVINVCVRVRAVGEDGLH